MRCSTLYALYGPDGRRLRAGGEPLRRRQLLRALREAANQARLMVQMAERRTKDERRKGGRTILQCGEIIVVEQYKYSPTSTLIWHSHTIRMIQQCSDATALSKQHNGSIAM